MNEESGIAFFYIFALLFFVILGTLLAAYEIALQSASWSRLDDMLSKRGKQRGRFLEAIIKDLQYYRFSAAFLGSSTIVSVVALSFHLFAFNETHSVFLLILLVIFIAAALRGFADLLGDIFAERLVIAFAAPFRITVFLFGWLLWTVFVFYRLLARGIGYDIEKKPEDIENEVIAAVSDGELAGVVNEDQRKMIERVFDFEHTNVADILTPRTEIEMLEINLSLTEAITRAQVSGYSRIPVYENTRDNIVGIFYIRDSLNHWGKSETPALRELLHKPLFVPETKNITEMLSLMKRSQTQIAIVLDEYGGTAGLVTFEDLLEEIVGNVRDEYDTTEQSYLVRSLAPGQVVIDGHVHVSDVNDALDLEKDEIPEDQDYDTIGGFVSFALGNIPQTGEEFTYQNLQIKILAADERRVKRVEIRYCPPSARNE